MSILVKNRYEVAYRPIPITDTDKHLPYRQNRYIGKKPISAPITDTYRYRLVHYLQQIHAFRWPWFEFKISCELIFIVAKHRSDLYTSKNKEQQVRDQVLPRIIIFLLPYSPY